MLFLLLWHWHDYSQQWIMYMTKIIFEITSVWDFWISFFCCKCFVEIKSVQSAVIMGTTKVWTFQNHKPHKPTCCHRASKNSFVALRIQTKGNWTDIDFNTGCIYNKLLCVVWMWSESCPGSYTVVVEASAADLAAGWWSIKTIYKNFVQPWDTFRWTNEEIPPKSQKLANT